MTNEQIKGGMTVSKNTVSRRDFLRMGALTTASIALAACGAPAKPEEAPEEAPAEAPAEEEVTIRLSVWGAVQEDVLYTDHYIPNYKDLKPNVTIDFLSIPDFGDYYDKLIQLHAAGTPVDVQRHNVQRIGQMLGKDMLTELSEFYKRDNVDTSNFVTGVMAPLSRENGTKIYGVPQDENLFGLLYNPELFDEAGLPYPDDDYTLDQMMVDATALTKKDSDGNVTQFGYIGWWGFWDLQGFILANGGKLWENLRTPDEVCVADDAWYQSLAYWQDLVVEFQLAAGTQEIGNLGANVFFEQKRAAMFPDGTWRIPFVRKAAPDLNFAVTSFPKGAVKKSRASSCVWSISTKTDHFDTCWELCKYLLTPEVSEAYWQILWVAPPADLRVVKSEAFKNITGLTAGGIEYPGLNLDDPNDFETKSRWIVTTLDEGWDTQEWCGDNWNILAREMDAAIESVLVPESPADVKQAIDQAVENTNREIELNKA